MQELIHFENSNYKITLCPYGATIVKLETKDRFGNFSNIVFTHQNYEDYKVNKKFAGSTIGPYAGRIYPTSITQGGKVYKVDEQGEILLHSGKDNFTFQKFEIMKDQNQISFILFPKYIGYPSANLIKVNYVFQENGFKIIFESHTDHDTYVNMTNHSYFNLSGEAGTSIFDHSIELDAIKVSELDDRTLPVKFIDVNNSIFDFSKFNTLGQLLMNVKDTPQQGLDHCYILGENKEIVLSHQKSGRTLKIKTDYSAVQIYTNNFPMSYKTESGEKDKKHQWVCFEAQHPVNDIHKGNSADSFQHAETIKKNSIEYSFN